MIETKNRGDLIKLLIAMARGPPHLESLCEFIKKKRQSLSLDYGKSFTIMDDEEITEVLKDISGLVVF
jgi:hypothetical protein